jgi:hypothetical protein
VDFRNIEAAKKLIYEDVLDLELLMKSKIAKIKEKSNETIFLEDLEKQLNHRAKYIFRKKYFYF